MSIVKMRDIVENFLYKKIKEKIMESGQDGIPFSAFMEMALYAEGGYYAKEKQKIGKEGDFYTSSNVHPIFGEMLAEYIWQRMEGITCQPKYIVEMGGGTGALSQHIIRHLVEKKKVSDFQYVLIEASSYHRRLQQEKLALYDGEGSVEFFSTIDEAKQRIPQLYGVFFSNELPDAFPVHIVCFQGGEWKEVYVALDESGGFIENLVPASPAVLAYCLEQKIPQQEGYRTEINLHSIRWMEEVSSWLAEGTCITIDYGYTRDEYYAPWRNRGTLMCYHNHQAHENPYLLVGEQDITAHINFTDLMETGEKNGLMPLLFLNQGEFLIQSGILEELQSHSARDPFHNETVRRNRAIRQLIMDGEMGRAFKVLVQVKKT